MHEVIVKNNTTGFRVYINGVPNLKNISKDEAEPTITALELQIAVHYDKKRNGESERIGGVTGTG